MHFSELRVYQLAALLRCELDRELAAITRPWTVPEVNQLRRSSSSIASNIVEGFGRRFYPKDFKRFLIISISSSDETQNHICALREKGYLSAEKTYYFANKYKTLSIQLLNYLNYIRKKHNI